MFSLTWSVVVVVVVVVVVEVVVVANWSHSDNK